MCVEGFSVLDSAGFVKDKHLIYKAVESAKLLGLWLQTSVPVESLGRLASQLNREKDSKDDDHVFDLDRISHNGGFLRYESGFNEKEMNAMLTEANKAYTRLKNVLPFLSFSRRAGLHCDCSPRCS